MSLRIDWCSYEAAKYAVEHWHYSGTMPAGKTVKIGVWEDEQFIGCVIFSRGANQYLGKMFELEQTGICELTRVALRTHESPVSQIVAAALKMLKASSPGLRLVLSYADVDQGHHGGIYIAGNWIYLGKVQLNGGTPSFLIRGRVRHPRSIGSLYGKGAQNLDWLRANVDPKAKHVWKKGKHKFVYPLDKAMRRKVTPLLQPYPEAEHADV